MKTYIFGLISLSTIRFYKNMSIKINYLKKAPGKSSSNIILFSNEKLKFNNSKKFLSNSEFSYINDLLKTLTKKKIYLFLKLNSKKKLF